MINIKILNIFYPILMPMVYLKEEEDCSNFYKTVS